jgi:membrane-bound ClpP family serine protease
MPLVTVVILIAVVGLLLWLINRFVPMQGTIKGILNGVVVIVLVVWLLRISGGMQYLSQFHVGH